MTNSAKLWDNAELEHRQRFQNLIFKEGLILNTNTLEFGTTRISPLYRYIGNKKDLSVTPKRYANSWVSPEATGGISSYL